MTVILKRGSYGPPSRRRNRRLKWKMRNPSVYPLRLSTARATQRAEAARKVTLPIIAASPTDRIRAP